MYASTSVHTLKILNTGRHDFRHPPPNSARTGYATEGPFSCRMQGGQPHTPSFAPTQFLQTLPYWLRRWRGTLLPDAVWATSHWVRSKDLAVVVPAVPPEHFFQHQKPGRHLGDRQPASTLNNTANPINNFYWQWYAATDSDMCFTSVLTCYIDHFKNSFFVRRLNFAGGITSSQLTTQLSSPSQPAKFVASLVKTALVSRQTSMHPRCGCVLWKLSCDFVSPSLPTETLKPLTLIAANLNAGVILVVTV